MNEEFLGLLFDMNELLFIMLFSVLALIDEYALLSRAYLF